MRELREDGRRMLRTTILTLLLTLLAGRPSSPMPSDESIQWAKDFLDQYPVFDGCEEKKNEIMSK